MDKGYEREKVSGDPVTTHGHSSKNKFQEHKPYSYRYCACMHTRTYTYSVTEGSTPYTSDPYFTSQALQSKVTRNQGSLQVPTKRW